MGTPTISPLLAKRPFFGGLTGLVPSRSFIADGQEAHGSADTNYTGSVPTVAITSPADMSKVSGIVEVQGNAQYDVSKVEF
jgi:Bacterial Ig domain